MNRKYAEGTSVPVNRSRDELERTLERFGATAQAWMRDDELKVVRVGFKRKGHGYRFTVALVATAAFTRTPTGQHRTPSRAEEVADGENRRRFRSLANFVKAMMDAADTGIISAEEALMPYMMLPSGATVAEEIMPQLALGEGRVNLARVLGSGSDAEGG